MKSKLDILLIVAMAICYTAGQFIATDRFAMLAGALLVVFIVRMLGSSITWMLTGR